MTADRPCFARRQFLVGTAVAASSAPWIGCSKDPESAVSEAAPVRSDVPLRLLMFGEPADGEAIQRGWGSVAEQPLDVSVVSMGRDAGGALEESLLAKAKKTDVLIYPLLMVGVASRESLVVELADEESDAIDAENGELAPAARNAGARFAGKTMALPLGASLPAVLSVDPIDPMNGWSDYDKVVESTWGNLAAEPTAEGWAGAMFLWRAMGVKNWLFSREDLTPLIDGEPYIDVLKQMVQTNQRYDRKGQTPSEIWNAVVQGELKGGIGYPLPRVEGDGEIQVNDLPGGSDLSKVMLDPFTPVVSLSANCRQTSIAKRFIRWISGGEGSEEVRRQVPAMNELRGGVPERGTIGIYDEWLSKRLQSPLTVPAMQIMDAGAYYAALDEAVIRALDGEASPADALSDAASRWRELNQAIGNDVQRRLWRQAQGMRA